MEVRKKRAEDKVERQLKIPAGTELPTAVRHRPPARGFLGGSLVCKSGC